MNNAKLRKIIPISIVGLLSFLTACGGKEEPKPSFYDTIYKEDKTLRKAPSADSDLFKASDYYRLSSSYWRYVAKEGGALLTIDKKEGKTSWNGCEFNANVLSIKEKTIGYLYKSPRSGEAHIKGNLKSVNGSKNPSTLTIVSPSGETLYEKNVAESDFDGVYFDVPVTLNNNDEVAILVTSKEGKVSINPRVEFEGYKEVLYQKPDWGFYGDVHPFYHNGRMYMYNLEGHLETPEDERLTWRLHVSDDLFNYRETDYEVFDFVKNHYNATLDVYESLFDKVTFPYGSRDMFLFFDSIAQRYVYFGLCYYQDMSSCLGYRISDDDTGMKWSGPMKSMKDYAFANDPECNQAMLINNRWYLLTSLWGESIHSVGKMTYYIGEEGKAFMENDWANAERHELDGEDLCAGQLVDVGENHFQLYGWIPKTSYNNDQEIYFNGTRDHGLWGGNINIPREVYAAPNGELRSKLDERASSILGRGSLIDVNQSISGSLDLESELPSRAYITTKLKLNGASKASLLLTAANKHYKVTLSEEGNMATMQIGCAEDTGHPIASKTSFVKNENGEYDIKLIADHSQFEFFVNDEHTLTARTSMFANTFKFGFESDGSATTWSNTKIQKLAHQDDVYDN
ncbi:MAG: glycoside hydrolase family 32 protein [Bacilli bacterium]|nr:glycoside hydrolase family 32 protein [Bacilli bacterium]